MMFSSISGSSSSNSSSSSISKGIGGLASGLDTDSLVENLTAGTTAKIDKQKQQQQLLLWQKDAYRTLTKGLMEFNDKYFSSLSATNITSSSFFETYKLNNLSEKIGLSGKLQNAQYVSVDKIIQLATKSAYSYKTNASNPLNAGIAVNTEPKYYSGLDGQSLAITTGDGKYSLKFDSNFGHLMKTAANEGANSEETYKKMADALNQMLADAGAVNAKGEATVKAAVSSEGVISFSAASGSGSVSVSGTKALLRQLGFGQETSVTGSGGNVKGASAMAQVVQKADFATQVSNKTLKFYLDGKTSTVTLPNYQGDEAYKDMTSDEILEDMAKEMNAQLVKDFGSRQDPTGATRSPAVKVDISGGALTFTIANAESSTFAVDSGGKFMLGKQGVFQVEAGTSTKFNASMTLKEMRLNTGGLSIQSDGYGTLAIKAGASGEMTLSSGKTISVTNGQLSDEDKKSLEEEGFTISRGGVFGEELVIKAKDTAKNYIAQVTPEAGKVMADMVDEDKNDALYKLSINGTDILLNDSDSLSKVMNKVNQSDAGVNMTYSAITGSMKLENKDWGAGREINFKDSAHADDDGWNGYSDITKALFGASLDSSEGNTNGITRTLGKNAIVNMTVNGEKMTGVERASNIVSVDGLNIELKAEHNGADDEPITFDVALDSDAVVENMKEFIETYNALITSINTAVTTKQDPDKKYEPLTDSQKENMSEKQIENWESEAKKSVLFGDSALKTVQQSLRSALYGVVSGVSASLSSIGITTGDWSKYGQLELDETKFRKALSDNPGMVADLFTQQSEIDYSIDNKTEQKNQRYKESGLMWRFSDILKSTVGTTTPKGTLLQIAGIDNDRTDADNQLSDRLKDIEKEIKKLQDHLKTERERYWKQFTNLETTIQNLNSQSSYISSMFES